MLDFSDLPYEFVPPKPNPLVIGLARFANRHFILPGKHHLLERIDLHGTDTFARLRKQGHARFVLLPNHPTHSDPQVMTEVCRRLRVKPAFMAAYDVFTRSKLDAWVMQRTGAFSVDREGGDRKSMKCATAILERGKYPLVIFPEGNVYLCNDRVTPFVEGAAYISLRTQKSLGSETPIYAVPVSLKYSYIENVRPAVLSELATIATRFDTELDRNAPVTSELKRIGIIALHRFLKQRGYVPSEDALLADVQIDRAAEQIIQSLESKMDLSPLPSDDLTGRVRKIRATVHAIRTGTDREVDHRAAAHWADEAMLALRILGYSGGYAAGNPTLDRVAETTSRLLEDVTSQCHPPQGKRRALVQIGEPIDLRDHLDAFNTNTRTAIRNLTATLESNVQSGIDQLAARNELPGTLPF